MTTPIDASRRRTLAQLSAVSLATLSPWAVRLAAAQTPLTVGVIYVGPRDDFGYNQAQAEAAAVMKVAPHFGARSGIPSGIQQDACLRRVVRAGLQARSHDPGRVANDGSGNRD